MSQSHNIPKNVETTNATPASAPPSERCSPSRRGCRCYDVFHVSRL
jgi:hypothetical protein